MTGPLFRAFTASTTNLPPGRSTVEALLGTRRMVRLAPGFGVRSDEAKPTHPGTALGLVVDVASSDLDAVLAALGGSEARVISRRPVLFEEPGSPWDGVRCADVADPDGVVLELVQRPED